MLFPSPFSLFSSTVSRFYEIGCFANKNKVINELKPQGSQSQSNEPAVLMCAKLAQDKNYHFFAVGHSGTCYSGPYPGWRYFKYRSILNCKKGGFFVYSFGKFVLIICELDLKKRLFIKTDNINDVFSSHYMAAKSEQSQVGAKLNALAVSCYRIILNIKRLDNVSNDRIYDLTGTSHLLLAVISRQLKFLCHILPTEKDELANIYPLYELPPSPPPANWRRPPGRPHKSFSSQAQKWINPNKHLSEDDIVCSDQDRASWRRLTVNCSTVYR